MPTGDRMPCPECQTPVKVDENAIGQQLCCGKCGGTFNIDDDRQSQATPASKDAESTLDATLSEASRADLPSGERRHFAALPSIGRIERFELKSILGRGGYGVVYHAHDPSLDRQVAIKVPRFASDQHRREERFLREAKAAARLRHPNIVAVFECGKADGRCYIASEYVNGIPMSDVIRNELPEFRQSAEWVRDLARALAYTHAEGVIHRDVKPANVMIGDEGLPQLMDFGLAKRVSEDSGMDRGRQSAGYTCLHGARASPRRSEECRSTQRSVQPGNGTV